MLQPVQFDAPRRVVQLGGLEFQAEEGHQTGHRGLGPGRQVFVTDPDDATGEAAFGGEADAGEVGPVFQRCARVADMGKGRP